MTVAENARISQQRYESSESADRAEESVLLADLNDVDQIEYVHHPSFSLPHTYNRLWGEDRDEICVEPYNIVPQELDDPDPGKRKTRLNAQEEKTLFLRYNYAKYRLIKLLKKPCPQQEEWSREVALWQSRARQSQRKLVHANLPLVPSMARRTRLAYVEFSEMLSEGYMAVLRSVEKFDVSRGYKFSTYACRSILSCFYRLSRKAHTRHKHIPVQFDTPIERSDADEQRHIRQLEGAVEAVREVIAHNWAGLTEAETRVLLDRFPICSTRKTRTLAGVGKKLGISSERVRQIERRSLAKVRQAVENHLAQTS